MPRPTTATVASRVRCAAGFSRSCLRAAQIPSQTTMMKPITVAVCIGYSCNRSIRLAPYDEAASDGFGLFVSGCAGPELFATATNAWKPV